MEDKVEVTKNEESIFSNFILSLKDKSTRLLKIKSIILSGLFKLLFTFFNEKYNSFTLFELLTSE